MNIVPGAKREFVYLIALIVLRLRPRQSSCNFILRLRMVGWMIAGTWPTQYQFRARFKCRRLRNMEENLVDLTTERNAAATYLALLPGFGSVT